MQQRIGLLYRQVLAFLKQLTQHKSITQTRHYGTQTYHAVREYSRIHQALVVLTIFILVNNTLIVRAANDVPSIPADVLVSDPYVIADTVRLLADYTPDVDEDPDAIALALEERVNGNFISTNPLIVTLPSESDTPNATETPAPPASTADRTREIKYTVQIGDTMSGIGSKFGLKVATIKVKNNINNVDTLKPGQELTIPVDDLSDKAIKAAEDRQKASQQLADAKKSVAKISTAKASGGYGLIVPIHHNGISRGLIAGVHTGIDYRANVGTPIVAAADGVVIVATETGWNGGYGKTVLISHTGNKTTRYGHMSDVSVRSGQRVSQGELIGYSGNTGRSTGPHLHFELRVGGRAVSPF
ncbi:MAG TPA: peptidoglycan DD-metalloendopeptidase family protein [Patescibacteria group bacterium]